MALMNTWEKMSDGSFTSQDGEYRLRVRETAFGRWAYEVTLRGTLMSLGDHARYEDATKAAEHAVAKLTER